jgi:hypothetical protein
MQNGTMGAFGILQDGPIQSASINTSRPEFFTAKVAFTHNRIRVPVVRNLRVSVKASRTVGVY